MKLLPKEHYSTAQIADMARISVSSAKERIRRLEIFPDFIKGKARYFNAEKVQCIISQIKYYKKTYYLILESKMNYDN
ncbi:hypothetical protein [Flavobacterium sp.]|jgi:transposase|uniref:hypothetical protein n=1 Tax=Flavobacterium sp. TaxID=239 RepID=UPI0025D746DD|nr:hypothetical protein [Flavobacterium sp.]